MTLYICRGEAFSISFDYGNKAELYHHEEEGWGKRRSPTSLGCLSARLQERQGGVEGSPWEGDEEEEAKGKIVPFCLAFDCRFLVLWLVYISMGSACRVSLSLKFFFWEATISLSFTVLLAVINYDCFVWYLMKDHVKST
jgi:hypothetical protein